MGPRALQRFKRIRLINGGILSIVIASFAILYFHPLIVFGILFCGLISSVRAILNGSPGAGLLLTKLTGICVIVFPFIAFSANGLEWLRDELRLDSYKEKATEKESSLAATPLIQETAVSPALGPFELVEPIENLTPKVVAKPAVKAPDLAPPVRSEPPPSIPSLMLTAYPEDKENPNFIEAVSLVKEMLEAEARRDIEGTMSRYADTIQYFGSEKSKPQVLGEKLAYFKKWPKASDTLISKYSVEVIARRYFSITFKSTFTVSNPNKSRSRSGTIDHQFTVSMLEDPMKITEQSGKVSNLKNLPTK